MENVTDINSMKKKFLTPERKVILTAIAKGAAVGTVIGLAASTPTLYSVIRQQARALKRLDAFIYEKDLYADLFKWVKENP